MFERLWDDHEWVKHDQLEWIQGSLNQDIALRFKVTNKLHDGTLVNKSNCNFFTLQNGLFSTVRVYMAGVNTLNKYVWGLNIHLGICRSRLWNLIFGIKSVGWYIFEVELW